MDDAETGTVQCPNCGHGLSMWREPPPGSAEALRIVMHAEVDLHRLEEKIDEFIVRQEAAK